MDASDAGFVIARIMAEAFVTLIWFSCGWFLIYAVLGSWLKVKLVDLNTDKNLRSVRRFGPVYVSHILFSLVFVNPFTIMMMVVWLMELGFNPQSKVSEISSQIFLISVYLWILAAVWEYLLLRVVPRWKRLQWCQWCPPLKKVVPVGLLVSTLGFGGGMAGVYMEGIMPTVLRSFPLRPEAFEWKVDTGTKPLADFSLTAESCRMMADDKYVYIQVNAKQHQWRVVDRSSHKILGDKVKALGYVLADDSEGSWEVRQSPDGLLYDRFLGQNPKTIPFAIARDAVFFEYQVNGFIIGANPSSGRLFALDPEEEKVAWDVVAPVAEGYDHRRIGSIAAANGIVAVGLWGSDIWAVDARTGESLWEFDEKGMGNAIHVVASKQKVVGFSRSDRAYAFDLKSGEAVWSEEVGDLAGGIGAGNVCLQGDRVVFRDESNVICLNAHTGKVLWRTAFGSHYSGGITCTNEGIAACTSDRTLALFNVKTGEEIFRTKFPVRSGIGYGDYSVFEKTPGRIYAHPVVAENGQVYVFIGDGVLWALNPNF